MMLAGFTALSVEMSTKRATSWRTHASATMREPRTLFFTASHAFDSISGTCLCAAAWNTNPGGVGQHLLDAAPVGDVGNDRCRSSDWNSSLMPSISSTSEIS